MSESTRTLRSGFLASRDRFPDRPALEVDGEPIAYAALDERARRLAATLEAAGALEPERLTAVFAHRSVTAYAGILAALFRGHGYVPLNPQFPADRTRTMLERSDCRSVIVDAAGLKLLGDVLEGVSEPRCILAPEADAETLAPLAARFPGHRFLGAAELASGAGFEPRPATPDDVAYLLFTSGSTGIPKGVMVAHRNAEHFLDVMAERYGVTEEDRFTQLFDLTFDLSVFDMFLAWQCGGCVCCPTAGQKMMPASYVAAAKPTVWFSVPSTAAVLNKLRKLTPGAFPSLRWALFCGEALPADLATAFAEAAPGATLENLYGPTELTIACTLYRFDPVSSPAECEQGLVPIGAPYPGMEVRVVDEALHEVEPGESGELLMTGPQLTPGYWRDAEKTAAAFLEPPGEDRVFYRTGDRVRRPLGDEPIKYLGRADHQIKIQGYRVELGEVEALLRDLAGTDTAIAVGWPVNAAGADGVVAFVGSGVDTGALLKTARARLPAYMAPREIREVADFPLNANGKVDRKALRAMLEAS